MTQGWGPRDGRRPAESQAPADDLRLTVNQGPADEDRLTANQGDRPALSIDCIGMACPRPIIELARRIGDVPLGSLIELIADDAAAGPDLIAWCRMRGQQLALTAAPRFMVRRLR